MPKNNAPDTDYEQALEQAKALDVIHDPDMSKGEAIVYGSMFLLLLAGGVAAIWAGIKDDQRHAEARKKREEEREAEAERRRQFKNDLEDWITDQENQGFNVYKLSDGRYVSVERTAKQVSYVKRQA